MEDERECEKERESCMRNMIMPYRDIHTYIHTYIHTESKEDSQRRG